jgi:biopolymer transport protein ExbD
VKKKKKQEETFAPPNLTALMDILSNIIFFLMASFGAQTLEMTASADISLPKSTSELSLKKAVAVAVGKAELFVEDQKVEINKLEPTLRRLRAQQLAKNELARDEDQIVLLIADEDLDYTTIDSVMKSCARAGYPKFRFVVSKS